MGAHFMQKRVLILLSNGFEVMEAGCFTEVFGWASIYGDIKFDQLSVGLRSPVKTTFGFDVLPEKLLPEIKPEDFDALVIPGGFGDAGFYEEALSEPFLDVVRNFHQRQAPIAAVCVSSLSLGAAGVLKGRRATIYHQAGGMRKAELESYACVFVDEPLVIDGHLMTSTGPGTGVELALKLLEMLSTTEFADDIRKRMRIPTPSSGWYEAAQVGLSEVQSGSNIALSAAVALDSVPAEEMTLVKKRPLTLNHVGIPARNPEALAAWYGVHFKLMVEGAFAYGDGWLIACELGAPLTEMPAHFGFMLDNRAEVDRWKGYFEEQGIAVDAQRNGNALFVTDPEGNSFEIFFDPTRFVAP